MTQNPTQLPGYSLSGAHVPTRSNTQPRPHTLSSLIHAGSGDCFGKTAPAPPFENYLGRHQTLSGQV